MKRMQLYMAITAGLIAGFVVGGVTGGLSPVKGTATAQQAVKFTIVWDGTVDANNKLVVTVPNSTNKHPGVRLGPPISDETLITLQKYFELKDGTLINGLCRVNPCMGGTCWVPC
jgi:hypothetical protein